MLDDMTYLGKTKHQASSAAHTLRQIWFEKGPYFEKGSSIIVVPSPRFLPEITKFWKSKGFQFRRDECGYAEWWRPTNHKFKGARYTPAGWLAAAQNHYKHFFPDWDENQPHNVQGD